MTSREIGRSSNVRSSITAAAQLRRSSRRFTTATKGDSCTCAQDLADSPMLKCGLCYRWYHFQCVNLAERDAEDLAYYVCPSCASATGKGSRELWELDDDEVPEIRVEDLVAVDSPSPHSSDDEGSEDNFVQVDAAVVTPDDASDHSEDETIGARIHRQSTRKRRSIFKHANPSAKRHKVEEVAKPSNSPMDDPIRKSCLKILINLLTPIFSEPLPEEPEHTIDTAHVESFAASLESCVFEIYAEQDEFGEKIPGNKYKERVRMLNFNLGKKDRQELRKSIRVGRITPSELSRMSSIDLANAQAQQEAQKLAEEAMNHSILQARTAPLRKITHKGEELIEKTVEEENWRVQEEDRERERAREHHRSRVDSISDSAPPITPVSITFRRASLDFPPADHRDEEPEHKAFDPVSTVFKMDFDGEGSNTLRNGPSTPPELSGTLGYTDALSGIVNNSPSTLSTSPTTQNFNLDELFGSSEPTHQSWTEPPETTESGGVQSATEEDMTAPDDTDFDAFITVDQDEPEQTQIDPTLDGSRPVAQPAQPSDRGPSLADLPSIWRGHLGMPAATDPGRMIQFQAEFKQIGGPLFNDTIENRHALFPTSLFEVIGRVPTAHAIKYLVSMRLNPTKELFAVALVPNEVDKQAYLELHRLLVEKDRYGLVFPWGQDPQLSAPGKELYIAPLLPEHPIPEYLQLLDNLKVPEKRDSPIFCGVFVLNRGRVTSLDPIDYAARPVTPAHAPTHASTSGTGPGDSVAVPPGPPVIPPVIPPALAPALASSLSNLSESTLATLTQDLANLNPTQLELVRSLLLQQAAPTSAAHPSLPASTLLDNEGQPLALPIGVPNPIPAPSASAASGQSPTRHAPASWDRPASYSLESNWVPGPGYLERDEFREDHSYHRVESRGPRGRPSGHFSYRGRGTRGSRW